MKVTHVIGMVAIGVLSAAANGWATSIMWSWFIMPLFSAPALSVPVAIGMTLILRHMTQDYSPDKQKFEAIEAISWAIAKPLTFLGIGWVVLQFV